MKDKLLNINDYKEFIVLQTKANRHLRSYRNRLAETAGIQPSYLSQVLRRDLHINVEQAHRLCEFWQFSEKETAYFIFLVEYARAGTRPLKNFFREQVETLRQELGKISHQVKGKPLDQGRAESGLYYSRWYISAVHMLCGIRPALTSEQMRHLLGLRDAEVKEALDILEQLKAVEKNGDEYTNQKRNIHAPAHSPLALWHHTNWRTQALRNVEKRESTSLHYTTLHSLSASDLEHLRALILDFIQQSRKIVDPSPAEKIVCLCLDYFVVC